MSLLLLLLLPAGAGTALVLLGPRAERVAAPLAAVAAVLTLLVVLLAGEARFAPLFLLGQPFALGLDGLSLALAVTVCVVTTCVLAAVPGQVGERRARLCGWLLLFLSSVLLTLTARSLLPLLVGWELMGAASWLLIGHDVGSRRAAASATTALITTRALDLGLYLAAGAALAGAGTLELAALPGLSGWPLHAAALGVVAAGVGKAAQLPASFWLSRAMEGPSPVSALLHSAAMVAMGGYLLVRTAPLLEASGWADVAVAWTGAATAVLLGLVALAQRDLKQLLAASTASQLGFVLVAAGIGARGAGATHLVAHAAVKSLLFLSAGLWLHALGTKDLGRLRGAVWRAPAVGALAALGLAALAGLPPLALWGSKDTVLAAAQEASLPLYLATLLAAGLSAAYAGRALALVLRRVPDDAPVPVPGRDGLPLAPLALGAAMLALLVVPGVRGRFGDLVGGDVEAGPLGLTVSGLLAVAAVVAVWRSAERLPDRLPAALGDWLRLEQAAHAVAVRPVLSLARAAAAFDDRVLDRAVEGAARGARRLSRGLGRFDDRGVDRAVEATAAGTVRLARGSSWADVAGIDGVVQAVARGLRRLGELARRPQTGQLHQYYAQAAAVLVAGTVLLLVVR